MMSLPSASCTSMVDSGVNMWRSPFEVRLKQHALFGDLAQPAQAENLEAAGIRQNRPRPVHEPVQPAELANGLMPRPQDTNDTCCPE